MAGSIVLGTRAASEVPSAPDGKVRVFFDESGRLALKDDAGHLTTPQALVAALETLVATKQDSATAATDSELASAVSTLTTAINTKQDASTATTDAELASAVSTLNAALATKQDASTAATDVQLKAAVSDLTTVIGKKQDAATAATDSELASAVAELGEAIAKKQDAATAATDAELASGLAAKQSISERGQANGYPSLDGSGHVPAAQMPVGALTYKGTWDASANTPTLVDGTGTTGDQYAISKGGTRNLGSGSVEFVAGAVLQYNGSAWQQLANPNAVGSVFGRKGTVAAQSGDYSIGQISGAGTAAAKDAGGAGAEGKVLNADDPVLPTSGQKSALAGNDGTPGSTNPYLTKQSLGAAGSSGKALKADDAATTDARTPKAHAASHADGGSDEIAITAVQVTDLGSAATADIGIDVASIEDPRFGAPLKDGAGVIVHGSNANLARGTDYAFYIWIGTVLPNNGSPNDLWINPTGA